MVELVKVPIVASVNGLPIMPPCPYIYFYMYQVHCTYYLTYLTQVPIYDKYFSYTKTIKFPPPSNKIFSDYSTDQLRYVSQIKSKKIISQSHNCIGYIVSAILVNSWKHLCVHVKRCFKKFNLICNNHCHNTSFYNSYLLYFLIHIFFLSVFL